MPRSRYVREMVISEYVVGARPSVGAPKDVAALCSFMSERAIEEFRVLCVDIQHKLVASCIVSTGILNTSLTHPREVFAKALENRAAFVILVHNHPSGNVSPSLDDRRATEQLISAGRVLDIPVLDHIIIGANGYYSFAESGDL